MKHEISWVQIAPLIGIFLISILICLMALIPMFGYISSIVEITSINEIVFLLQIMDVLLMVLVITTIIGVCQDLDIILYPEGTNFITAIFVIFCISTAGFIFSVVLETYPIISLLFKSIAIMAAIKLVHFTLTPPSPIVPIRRF